MTAVLATLCRPAETSGLWVQRRGQQLPGDQLHAGVGLSRSLTSEKSSLCDNLSTRLSLWLRRWRRSDCRRWWTRGEPATEVGPLFRVSPDSHHSGACPVYGQAGSYHRNQHVKQRYFSGISCFLTQHVDGATTQTPEERRDSPCAPVSLVQGLSAQAYG